MQPTVEQIAQVCHEANLALCQVFGDPLLPHWDELQQSYKDSTINGVLLARDGAASSADLHASWMQERLSNGWVYGPVLDREAKVHPCLVPYDELPPHQRLKDDVFNAIVRALSDK